MPASPALRPFKWWRIRQEYTAPLAFLGCAGDQPTGLVQEDAFLIPPFGQHESEPGTMAHLVRGKFNGAVTGSAILPEDGGKLGTVVGVTVPSEAYPHWCVNVAFDEIDGLKS